MCSDYYSNSWCPSTDLTVENEWRDVGCTLFLIPLTTYCQVYVRAYNSPFPTPQKMDSPNIGTAAYPQKLKYAE
jgi:hypothetical protein